MEATHQLEHENGDIATSSDFTEIEDITEEDDILIPREYDIFSYGVDYPVDSLVRRMKDGSIVVPMFADYSSDDDRITGFQRNYVWPKRKGDRFIESLLLGLPVPGIFLVREESGRLLVLDGQQRLKY